MKLAKWLGISVAAAAAALLLVGCGNSNSSSGSNTNNKTITFWYGGDADTAVKPMVDAFTKKTGIKVKIQSIPWSQYNDKLLTAAASKSGPDLILMGTTGMANYVSSKSLMDISKEVKSDKNISPNNYFEGSVKTTEFNGKYYAVPWYVETRVLY
ncbi:extracellular solute-binding protein [Schleiferilactobacillus harbinensis]|nr:extracellular solute-binding protein [Schleiferilactobacillus harbinensis]